VRKAFLSLVTVVLLADPIALSVFSASQPSSVTLTSDSSYVYLQNSYVELAFTKSSGGIYSIIDKSTGIDLVASKSFSQVFGFITNASGYSAPEYVHSNDALSFSYASVAGPDEVTLEMEWSGFYNNGFTYHIDASVNVTLTGSSQLSAWRIKLVNHDRYAITVVDFPVVVGLGQMSRSPLDDYYVQPALEGMLFQDPLHNLLPNTGLGGIGPGDPYPGGLTDMQFAAYYSTETGDGVYMAANDTAGYAKTPWLGHEARAGPLHLSFQFFPSYVAGGGVTLPYYMILGPFEGDWYDAAQIYRTWALSQWWARGGPLTTNEGIPTWMKNTSVLADYVNAYGSAQTILHSFTYVPLLAESMTQAYQSSPLITWRGWENHGWFGGPPDNLPAFGGWTNFDSIANTIHRDGAHIIVDENSGNVFVNSSIWSKARQYATIDQAGGYYVSYASVYDNTNTLRAETVVMINPVPLWQATLVNMTTALASNGIDALILDGGGQGPYFDYSTTHQNPVGGGNWWFQGLQSIYAAIRQSSRAVNPGFSFSIEFCSEVYIPYLDLCTDQSTDGIDPTNIAPGGVYNESQISFVPLWQAVYHDYIPSWAMIALIDGTDAPYYARGMGLGLTRGEDVTVGISGCCDSNGGTTPYALNMYDPPMVNYSENIAMARGSYAHDFLVLGRMLHDLNISSPSTVIPATTQRIPYMGGTVPSFTSPSVLGSAWRAPDGSVAVVLTNISGETANATLQLTNIGLTNESSYDAYAVRNGAFAYVGHVETGSLNVALGPLEVYALILAPASGQRAAGAASLNGAISMIRAVEERGYDVGGVARFLANATRAFYSDNYVAESAYIQQVDAGLAQIQATVSTTSSAVSSASSQVASSSATSSTSQVSSTETTASSTSSSSGGAVPEFPFQLAATVALVTAVSLSYLVLRKKLERR
jgi:hypothetical protein